MNVGARGKEKKRGREGERETEGKKKGEELQGMGGEKRKRKKWGGWGLGRRVGKET